MIDESKIEWLLNGERAEADVLNRPLRQLVRATSDSLSEFEDNISDLIDDTTLLIEERYDNVFEVTRDGNGFTREKDARLIFDADNATVSIAPGLGKSTWFYYHKGRKIESSEILTYTLSGADKTGGGFYLSFDKDGNFVNTGRYPDFFNTTLCFYVHYSNGEFIIEGDERHSADRDTAWHASHHREDGMVVYTLGSVDWTPNDANKVGIQITTTLVADEDLQHLIKHSPTGVEPFSQILEGSQDTVRIPTLYYDGSIRYLANKKLPWVVSALKYNDGTTLKDVPNGKFVNYFLAATHCQKYPIKLFMGRKLFDSDHETVDETLESLGLNFPEMAMLYRISIERDNSLSTVGKCKLKSVQQAASKITFESSAGSAGSDLSNHTQLLGRTADNAHPISAITGLQEALSDAQSSTTAALATKADKSTQVIAGTGLTGGGTLASNRTLNVSYGTTAGTAVQGNDSRVVNAASNATVNAKESALEAKKADKAITITAGTGLSGGGTLAANRSLSVNYGTTAGTAAQGNDSRITGALQSSQVVQATGTSTTNVMSQKATTDALNTKAASSHTHPWAQVTGQPATATRWPTFAEVTGKPATYAPSAHTHPWAQVTGAPAQATRWPTFAEVTSAPATATRWPTFAEVTGKPTSFTPASHTHAWAQVTGQPATATRWPTFAEVTGKPTNYATTWDSVASKPTTATRWPTWSEVTSKPTTFAPSSHTHTVSEVTGLGTAATTNNGIASGQNIINFAVDGIGNISYSNTLRNTTTGSYNTASGVSALSSNTTGSNNTASGGEALTRNTSGSYNTANGVLALAFNTTGNYNTSSGYDALLRNTSGNYNTSSGYCALRTNTTGGYNAAIGSSALRENTTGNYNTASGYNALFNNTTGGQNTASGADALQKNTSGNDNTAIGSSAIKGNTTGIQNTAIGSSALLSNTSGNNNTAIGATALYYNDGYDNCSGFGYNAAVTASNQVQLGDAATTTYTYGAVQNRSDARDKAEVRDTVLGLDFILAQRPVDYKWDMREDYREELGDDPTPEQLEAYKLANIKTDGTHTRNRYHHGLIAQEVAASLKGLNVDFGGYQEHSKSGGDDVLSLGYEEFIAPLIKAVQELNAKIDALESKK